MDASQTDYSENDLFIQLEETHAEAARAIEYVIRKTGENPLPCLNEARYAGKHLIRYMRGLDGSLQQRKEELRRALCHFQRVKKDALQYILMRYSQRYARLEGYLDRRRAFRKKIMGKYDMLFREAVSASFALPYIAAGLDEELKGNMKMSNLEKILDLRLLPLDNLFGKIPYMSNLKIEKNDDPQKIIEEDRTGNMNPTIEEVMGLYDHVECLMAFMSTRAATEPLPRGACIQMGYAGLTLSAYIINSSLGKLPSTQTLHKASSFAYASLFDIAFPYISEEFHTIRKRVKKFAGCTEILSSIQLKNGWKFELEEFVKLDKAFFTIDRFERVFFAHGKYTEDDIINIVKGTEKESIRELIIFIQNFNQLWSLYHRELEAKLKKANSRSIFGIIVRLSPIIGVIIAACTFYCTFCRNTDKQDSSSTQSPATQIEGESEARVHN